MSDLILYHGSNSIIEKPEFGKGKPYNDYGLGFYCTRSSELAKEWACSTSTQNGYVNEYSIKTDELNVFDLGKENILNWLAVLLQNRTFNIKTPLAVEAKQYLESEFLIDLSIYDIVCGPRADDSYFSFADSFLNGVLSLEQLSKAMKLGNLGEQIMIKSEKAFEILDFKTYEDVNQEIYYPKRIKRNDEARVQFKLMSNDIKASNSVYMIDILRQEWKNNDPRL